MDPDQQVLKKRLRRFKTVPLYVKPGAAAMSIWSARSSPAG